MSSLPDFSKWTQGAEVTVEFEGGTTASIAAAFVFDLGDGELIFVEPGYNDPWNARPADHRLTNARATTDSVVQAKAGTMNVVIERVGTELGQGSDSARAVAELMRAVEARGGKFESERVRVLEDVLRVPA